MIQDFIKELEEKRIKIHFSKGKLKYSGPQENITNEILQDLKKYKSQLLKYYWPEECVNMMPVNTEGSKTPLTLLHAGPSNYTISDFLGKSQPFYGFFYMGSEGEKIQYKKLEDFASAYLRQLQMIIPDGPYLVGGFSIGGNLAYEMAIQLQHQGLKVPLLVLVDSVLPVFHKAEKYDQLLKNIYMFFYRTMKRSYHLAKNIFKRIYYGLANIFIDNLPKDKRRKYILWRYQILLRKYKPKEEFLGDILLFKAAENQSRFKYLGWEKVCKNIEVITFPGFHGAMYNDRASIDMISKSIGKWVQDHKS